MATFSGNGSGTTGASSYTLKLDVWENNVDNANNKSNVGWKLALDSGNYSFIDYPIYTKVNVDGEVYNASPRLSINPNSEIIIASGSKDVYHDSNGSKSISCSASISNTSAYYLPGNINVSGNLKLTDIPRYANVSITEREKSVNTISINWNSDAARDHTQYSLNNGNWINANDTVSNGNKSGFFVIRNLDPKTTYSVKVRVKRTDSQLWSESNTLNIATNDIARFIDFKDILKLGKDYIVKFSNFGNAEVKIALLKKDNDDFIINYKNIENNTNLLNENEAIDVYKLFRNKNYMNAQISLKTIQNSKEYFDTKDILIELTGNLKTAKIRKNKTIKKAQIFVKQDGILKKAIVLVKQNDEIKRCI